MKLNSNCVVVAFQINYYYYCLFGDSVTVSIKESYFIRFIYQHNDNVTMVCLALVPEKRTEALVFSPDASEETKTRKQSSFVLNEVNSIDFSELSDDVFSDVNKVGPGASVPKVIVEDFGSCSKVDEAGKGLVL